MTVFPPRIRGQNRAVFDHAPVAKWSRIDLVTSRELTAFGPGLESDRAEGKELAIADKLYADHEG